MKYPTSRVAHLHRHDHRLNLDAALEVSIPPLAELCRDLTLFLLIAAFWGIVVYCALLTAL
jgi:hypothetical protein